MIGYGESPLRRLLSTTWPLFRTFRVDVRVSWTIAVWPLFFTWGLAEWLPLGAALLWGVAWTLALFTTVWTHEMGHIAMGRRLGVDSRTITLSGLGGLAHLDGPAQTPRDEILISLAGPATHFVWLAVLYPLVWMLEGAFAGELWFVMVDALISMQFSLMVFNLLPVYPLDGGRTLRGALATRMHANKASYHVATIGFVGNGIFVLLGLISFAKLWDPFGYGSFGFLPAWIGIVGIQACRRLRFQARHDDVYADHDPFQKTLLASHAALRDLDRAEEKARAARRERQDERRALQETVDRILDRITDVGGVDALPARERRELEKASRRLAELD